MATKLNLNWNDPTKLTTTDGDPLNVTNPLGITDFSNILGNLGATPGINPAGDSKQLGTDAWKLDWFGGKSADGTFQNGILPTSIGALSGIAGAYLGFQQLKLGEQQLEQNKRIFNLNFANQANSINTELEDRQRARVASNPSAYENVTDYMKRNSVSPKGI